MNKELIYFKGPVNEMADVYEKAQKCCVCQDEKIGYLDGPNHICLDCNPHHIFKDTEAGILNDKLEFICDDNEQKLTGINIPLENRGEFSRTPNFITWQQGRWLNHCDDFMVYLGEWKPLDFLVKSSTNLMTPYELFKEMTDFDEIPEWLHDFLKNKWPDEWGITYYSFQCRCCKKYRGYWDSD